MYEFFENKQSKKIKTLAAAKSVINDFDRLLPNFDANCQDLIDRQKTEIKDITRELNWRKTLSSQSLSSDVQSSNTNQFEIELLNNKLTDLESKIEYLNNIINAKTKDKLDLNSDMNGLNELIELAYKNPRALHSTWESKEHCVITEMTYLIRKISNTLFTHREKVPLSIINYALAERAELPAKWRFNYLKNMLFGVPFVVGMSLMCSPIFIGFIALMASFYMSPAVIVVPFFLGCGLAITTIAIKAIFDHYKLPVEEKFAIWLLGKFEDIGEINLQTENVDIDTIQSAPATDDNSIVYLEKSDKRVQKLGYELSDYFTIR